MDIQTFLQASQAFARNFVPVISGSLAALIGLYLVGSSVVTLIRMGDPQRSGADATWVGVGVKLLIGAMLLQFTATMQNVSQLIFGVSIQDYHGALAYAPIPQGSGGQLARQVFEICLVWFAMLGWIAALRGLFLWSTAANGNSGGQGGDAFWKGVWHIVGAACAINVTGFIQSFLGK
jgi:hypothetical protein